MGQTLTHGVYLPDKGERNCYSGLAANWAILDNAVGTIAEHTAALSRKAPLVHTHTKSDITDFPAYGTTAGTICEGNDSRLSDARTPVAHTHTKSDVTDLLNSNFIPSANNSYDLGSSSYQWNNLYAKNYYYNGVAWGLDKANVWSAENWFTASNLNLRETVLQRGVLPSSNRSRRFRFTDKNNSEMGWLQYRVGTNGNSYLELYASNSFDNGQLSDQGSNIANKLSLGLFSDGQKYATIESDFYPAYTNLQLNLGTSTNKWKTLNGINPGALSLPTTDSAKWMDLLGSLTAANSKSTYTPAVDGWISVMLKRTGDSTAVFLMQGNIKASCFSNTALVGESAFAASACIPVRAGISVDIHLKGSGSTIDSAYFMPCQGNV